LLGASLAFSASEHDDYFTSRTNVLYGNADGQDLSMDIYIPIGTEPSSESPLRPAIVFIHGGGWVGGDKSAYVDYCSWFARRGFAGFNINYRLVKPDGNQWPAQINDAQLAVRWVRDHADEYRVDPNRVGVFGDSAGGHLVALLGTWPDRNTSSEKLGSYSNRVNCVVDLYGPTDLTAPLPTKGPFNINVEKLVDDLLGGPKSERMELARAASPLFHVSAGDSPFLIFHGDKDPLVPLDQSQRLNEALKEAGVESRLVVFEGAGHGFGPPLQVKMRAECLEFFNRHLGAKLR